MKDTIDCQSLISSYLALLGAGFDARAYGTDGCRVTTPFWREDGDHLELFVLPASNGRVLVSDEGQTVDWLYSIGLDIETSDSRRDLLERIANSYEATLRDGVMSIETDLKHASETVHLLVQALLAASQMTTQRIQRTAKTFKEEVERFLTENNQRYQLDFPIMGKSSEHRIDFHFNSNRNILMETISASSTSGARDRVLRVAFEWIDIREAGWDFQCFSLVDDSDDKWEQIWQNERLRAPIESYSDKIIYWSQKATLLGLLD